MNSWVGMYSIIRGDVMDVLDVRGADVLLADPPDNIGLGYGTYRDNLSDGDYRSWMELLILKSLPRCRTLFLSVNYKWVCMVGGILDRVVRMRHPAFGVRMFVWHYNFGNYQESDYVNAYRPIFRVSRLVGNRVLSRVASERQRLGDSRADARGRVDSDVWSIPRIQGNSVERRSWHPTQHPIGIWCKCLDGEPGTVMDLFGGTGSGLRACMQLGRECVSVDIDAGYCAKLGAELGIPVTEWTG